MNALKIEIEGPSIALDVVQLFGICPIVGNQPKRVDPDRARGIRAGMTSLFRAPELLHNQVSD